MSIHLLSRGLLKAPSGGGGGGPTFVGAASNFDGNNWTMSVDISGISVSAGDLILVHHVCGDDTGINTPSGFALVDGPETGLAGSWPHLRTYAKASAAGSETSVTITTVGSAYKATGAIVEVWASAAVGANSANTGFAPSSLATTSLTGTAGSALSNAWVASNAITLPGVGTQAGSSVGASGTFLSAEYETGLAGGSTTARTATFSSGSACACHTIEIDAA